MIGDLYDKYDYFDLSLDFILVDTTGTITYSADKLTKIKIGRLPFYIRHIMLQIKLMTVSAQCQHLLLMLIQVCNKIFMDQDL